MWGEWDAPLIRAAGWVATAMVMTVVTDNRQAEVVSRLPERERERERGEGESERERDREREGRKGERENSKKREKRRESKVHV